MLKANNLVILSMPLFSAIEHRLTVNVITPALPDWTCKIQVVDKFRPRENTIHFQTIISQDENVLWFLDNKCLQPQNISSSSNLQEQQVLIVLYGDRYHHCEG